MPIIPWIFQYKFKPQFIFFPEEFNALALYYSLSSILQHLCVLFYTAPKDNSLESHFRNHVVEHLHGTLNSLMALPPPYLIPWNPHHPITTCEGWIGFLSLPISLQQSRTGEGFTIVRLALLCHCFPDATLLRFKMRWACLGPWWWHNALMTVRARAVANHRGSWRLGCDLPAVTCVCMWQSCCERCVGISFRASLSKRDLRLARQLGGD